MIIETHAHYDDKAFDEDRDRLLSSFGKNGIICVINVSADIASNDATIALTRKHPFIYGALGVHPSETGELTEESFHYIEELCMKMHIEQGRGKIVAVGEIGLDYYWNDPEPSHQKKWFRRQLELSVEMRLPVIIHSRDAARDTLDMIKEYGDRLMGGVFHCYSYSKEFARECLDIGFYFGIGGVVTFKNAKKLKEVVEFLPMNRILLETDSPYLAPVPYRGKRNSSLHLSEIAKEIATIKNISYEDVVKQTHDNARKLFGIR